MLDHKASRFYRAALQSGLIDEESLDACWAAIPDDKRTADAIDRRMARQAITAGHLTLWQAQQILSGRVNGYKIDKYLLLDLIGRGGMGRVYLAKDLRLNRRVALKILSLERMTNPRAIARFQREAKVGAQLQHENLVRVYDEGESNGIRFLVMEYIEGKNIGQMIGEMGSIPWPTAARLARQVALGLEHARLKGLIHRDVNPCNILVMADGTAKLTDLGLAIDLADDENVTRDGATVGTFDYVSPEQARHSRSVDTRADLYSLGCTLFHMIAGRVPFPVASLPEKLYAHQLHDPEPLNELVPGVPEGLASVVRKLMRKNPDERQATPQIVAQELEPYALEVGWRPSEAVPVAVAGRTDPTAVTSVSPSTREMNGGGRPASWSPGRVQDTEAESFAAPSASGSNSAQGLGGPDSFFPLDLGPQASLSEGLRPPSKSSKSRSSTANPDASSRPRPAWPWAAGVAAATLALAALIFAIVKFWPSDPGTTPPVGGPNKGDGKPVDPPGELLVKGRDGQSLAYKTLPEAVARAARSGGEVVLASAKPLHLTNKTPIIIPNGVSLVIRAADGVRPVLDVQLAGTSPLFSSRSPVVLRGLTIIARRDAASVAPLLHAEREATLERCILRSEGNGKGSRALLLEGSRTTIVGCLFVGFEVPMDVLATPGASVEIRKSIILAESSGASEDDDSGAVIHVLNSFGLRDPKKVAGGPVCRLSVESSTFRAGEFLDVNQFAESAPLGVSVSDSAFQVRALIEYGDEKPTKDGLAKAILWEGKENRFQVAGPGWVTVPGRGPMPDGPADLKAWSQLVRETSSEAEAWKPAPDAPDPANPHDYALVGEDGIVRGADPDQVGPR